MKNDGGGKTVNFYYLCQIFHETTKLDVWDLNFFFSDFDALRWSLIHLESSKNRLRKGFFPQLFIYFGRFTRRLFRVFDRNFQRTKIDKPIIFLGFTKNQIDSLIPVYKKIRDSATIIDGPNSHLWSLLILNAYFCSLFFFPWAIRDYIFSDESRRVGIKYNFANHWLTYGLYFVSRLLMRNKSIKCIVLANDHNMEPRVIIKAAKAEEKTSFYLQHASVTRVFPPLIVDYALLDGMDALGHYEAAGFSNSKIFLIGSPRFDDFISDINNHSNLKALGICVNLFDPYERVKSLITVLKTKFPELSIIMRIHPGQDKRDLWERLARLLSIDYSDSLTEGIFPFLKKVDAIMAGNSNVHLDAAMLNVYPIYYDFPSDREMRYYTFIEKGLCYVAEDENAACHFIARLMEKKPDIRYRAKNYCETVDTNSDGFSGDLASELIIEILQSATNKSKKWKKIAASNLVVYGLHEKRKFPS